MFNANSSKKTIENPYLKRKSRKNDNAKAPIIAQNQNKNQKTDNIKIILDTETTGLSPELGERMCEVACIKIDKNLKIIDTFQEYLNPQRRVSPKAFEIHGLSDDFLAEKPLFTAVVDNFLNFIGSSPLVIHNAPFDVKFLNSELNHANRPSLNNQVIDTLPIAREMFPNERVNLNELCDRFNISRENRVLHGALIDCELLLDVYRNLNRLPSSPTTEATEATAPTKELDEPVQKKTKYK